MLFIKSLSLSLSHTHTHIHTPPTHKVPTQGACAHLVEYSLPKVVCDNAKTVLRGIQLLEELFVSIGIIRLGINHIQHLLAVLRVDDALRLHVWRCVFMCIGE